MKTIIKTLSLFVVSSFLLAFGGVSYAADTELQKAEKECKQGDINQCYEAGYILANGDDEEAKRALPYFLKACENNLGIGCFSAGTSYEEDDNYAIKGLKKSNEKALYYYSLGCNLDNGESCERLGSFFEKGIKVKKSYVIAAKMYMKACTIGSEFEFGCQKLSEKSFQSLVASENPNLAREIARKYANQPFPPVREPAPNNALVERVENASLGIDETVTVKQAFSNYGGCVLGTATFKTATGPRGEKQVVFSCQYDYKKMVNSAFGSMAGFGPMKLSTTPVQVLQKLVKEDPDTFIQTFGKQETEKFLSLNPNQWKLKAVFTFSATNPDSFSITKIDLLSEGSKGSVAWPAMTVYSLGKYGSKLGQQLDGIYKGLPIITNTLGILKSYNINDLRVITLTQMIMKEGDKK